MSEQEKPRRVALLLGHDSQVLILTQPDGSAIRLVRAWIRAETGEKNGEALPAELEGLLGIMRDETARVKAGREKMSDGGKAGMKNRWSGDKVGIRSDKVGITQIQDTNTSDKKESVGGKPPRAPAKRFTPPTVEEVAAYANGAGLRMDAARFVDHFTANGWKVGGRAPMKDWKAAARNWARNDTMRNSAPAPASATQPPMRLFTDDDSI